jgi:hypothetical protein
MVHLWAIRATAVVAAAAILLHYCGALTSLTTLLQVGSGFTAHTVCSGLFVSNLPLQTIENNEIAGLAAALFDVRVNYQEKYVDVFIFAPLTKNLLNMTPLARSRYVGSSLGCRLERRNDRPKLPEPLSYDDKDSFGLPQSAEHSTVADEDNGVPININHIVQQFVDAELTETSLKANQTRALVVMHKGTIIGEGYQHLIGVSHRSALLGWSMTKSVFAVVLAAAVADGLVALNSPTSLEFGTSSMAEKINANRNVTEGITNKRITFGDLVTMADVLDFEENYGIGKTVSQMLFASDDIAQFALHRKDNRKIHSLDSTNEHRDKKSTEFPWYYSSGLSNILSYELSRLFPSLREYWEYPFKRVLHRIGATSFVLETDRLLPSHVTCYLCCGILMLFFPFQQRGFVCGLILQLCHGSSLGSTRSAVAPGRELEW